MQSLPLRLAAALFVLALPLSAQMRIAPKGHVPAVAGAPVPGAPAEFDYGASLTLKKEDIADREKFEAAAKAMFEGYLAHEGIGGIAASIARRRFASVVPWNHQFAKDHADSLTLSYATVEAAGKKRFAQRTTMSYNGKTVDLYRYADGVKSATSIFIDGAEEKDADGKSLRFFTSDEATYKKYVAWFHGRLGEPARP
ncbi:MAG: hypothetical protein HY928_12330 [Elusimicrobia bacterium]|nr:hypothetical protein [Elusimicrobiota bacterium]